MEMFTHNEGARNEVARTRKIHELTHGAARSGGGLASAQSAAGRAEGRASR